MVSQWPAPNRRPEQHWIAQRHCWQILRSIDLDHRHISLGVKSLNGAAIDFAGLQADDNARGIFDYVIVSEYVALRIDNEATANSAHGAALLLLKHIQQGVVRRLIVFVVVALF